MRLATIAAVACLILSTNSALGQGNYRIHRSQPADPVFSVSDQRDIAAGSNSVSSFQLPQPSQTESQLQMKKGWANEFADDPDAKTLLDAAAFANRVLQTVRTRPTQPSFPRNQNFPAPLQGNVLTPSEVARLSGRHVTLVMDKSGSMKTEDCAMPMSLGAFAPRSLSRWDWCLNQTVDLARQTAQVLPEGLSLVFFSGSDSVYHNVRANTIPNLFMRNSPEGGTNLVGALRRQLDDYFRAQSMGNRRPLVLAVVTDGAPDSPRALKDLIIEATHKMTAPNQLTISFLQVGNDPKGSDLLEELDRELTTKGASYDIVNVTPFQQVMGRGLAKSLVAAVQSPPSSRRF